MEQQTHCMQLIKYSTSTNILKYTVRRKYTVSTLKVQDHENKPKNEITEMAESLCKAVSYV